MSPSPSEDVNKPLPRKSRQDSLAWAKQYTSAMAHYAEVEIGHQFGPLENFGDCVGKHDEVADDGRYRLTYTVYAKLPRDQHIAAARKLRTALKEHGVEITDFTERPEKPEVIMYARHPREKFFVVADTVKPPNTLRLEVSTPCFLPPGAKQQKF